MWAVGTDVIQYQVALGILHYWNEFHTVWKMTKCNFYPQIHRFFPTTPSSTINYDSLQLLAEI